MPPLSSLAPKSPRRQSKPMAEFDIQSHGFQQAELRSEGTRVVTLLGVLSGLLVLLLARAAASVAQGRRGEAWPFAVLLGVTIGYEAVWLAFIRRRMAASRVISGRLWAASILLESLLPASALFLQVHTAAVGPGAALTSPVVATYFLFIILSTLHLDPGLSRLAGISAAAGYGVVAAYAFLSFPEAVGNEPLLTYVTWFSYAALLLLSGFAAAVVADQIRMHVVAALRDAENRAKIAQMEHDLDVARSIQEGLLPSSAPRIVNFDAAGWNQPADETGGDYFDWQELEDGRIAFTIADVTGHGIGPALCMAACRAYARAVFAAETNLRTVLGRLNRLLFEDLPAERFVTLAAGILDPDDATLELISAGHGPLLFFLAGENRFRSYDAHGIPLGLMPDAAYGCPQVLRFAPGDILLLITDGFVEWPNERGEQFGQKRLIEVVRANCHQPAAKIISEVYSSLLDFAGSTPQHDDLTAVVIKRVRAAA